MTEKQSITIWLKAKIKEANLCAADTRDFVKWLAVRCDHQTDFSDQKKVSMEEVHSLFSWLEEKLRSEHVTEAERQQLNGWLLKRLSQQDGDK